MPVPSPRKGEDRKKFISRCISTMEERDPERDSKQIQAICYRQWREKKKTKKADTKESNE